MGLKSKTNWYNLMSNQEKAAMEKQTTGETLLNDKKSKKLTKDSVAHSSTSTLSEFAEPRAMLKITFEGEAAQKILRCESELKERLSKPDMGKILGNEILAWTDKRWSEIVEENTDIDYFFAQIRKCPDKSKSIKLLKALSEKLESESNEESAILASSTAQEVLGALSEPAQHSVEIEAQL